MDWRKIDWHEIMEIAERWQPRGNREMSAVCELTQQQEEDLETMRGAFGLYVGQLTSSEVEAFDRLCSDGLARRNYFGAAGLLGSAKADRLSTPTSQP